MGLRKRVTEQQSRVQEAPPSSPYKERRERPEFNSTIEINGETHTFTNYSSQHEEIEQVVNELKSLVEKMKQDGAPESLFEEDVLYHSEKLALAYGLMKTISGFPLIISKSMPTCKNCHEFFNYVSKLLNRRIVLTDPHCFHSFSEGECNCNGVCI
eukprot:TRINITY_DN8924_c0_g1_i1.p1 TRINITY_DN8924_c0_g1~~TRINITY_DN8924_c0_g1_i1.p1  ORF type:complete len:156 (-),score=11.51 TRINITY_DN8924_c0_g1_i1:400-867(-)